MKIENSYSNVVYNLKQKPEKNIQKYDFTSAQDILDLNLAGKRRDISFGANPVKAVKDYLKFLQVSRFVKNLETYLNAQPNHEKLHFRNLSMEYLEGIQYGIKVFKGLSMKDIQYLSENLHVIAVKRGCNNMCGYCYADAKPSKREMSWEDFTTITRGFKTLRKRLGSLPPLFGESLPTSREAIYRTTELFYDSDCMNLSIKDKKGRIYDMRDLVTEVYESIGRKSCFDTSGWNPDNKAMQERAEKYAEYFSKPENMNKLEAFNLSFNPFNASYVAGVKALRTNDFDKYVRLRGKFTDRIANAIYTFTPLMKQDNFNILVRCFGLQSEHATHFNFEAMLGLTQEVLKKVEGLYKKDLEGCQKYVKSQADIDTYIKLIRKKTERISTGLNSSGRMKQFIETFKIKDSTLQNHTETTKLMYKELQTEGRYHRHLALRLIDTDGRVYHMDYARFFPTGIQLNIKDKTPTPKLANLRENCPVTKEIINREETHHAISDFL